MNVIFIIAAIVSLVSMSAPTAIFYPIPPNHRQQSKTNPLLALKFFKIPSQT